MFIASLHPKDVKYLIFVFIYVLLEHININKRNFVCKNIYRGRERALRSHTNDIILYEYFNTCLFFLISLPQQNNYRWTRELKRKPHKPCANTQLEMKLISLIESQFLSMYKLFQRLFNDISIYKALLFSYLEYDITGIMPAIARRMTFSEIYRADRSEDFISIIDTGQRGQLDISRSVIYIYIF